MNALSQYKDFYRQYAAGIEAHSAAPLNALRPRALEALEEAVLPRRDSDNYENCDLEAMLAPDYGINVSEVDMGMRPEPVFRCEVPVAGESPLLVINDRVVPPAGMPALPEGVLFGSLRSIAREHPEIVERYYGRAAEIANPVVALDTLLARDGVMLYVPRGVRLERPLQIVNVLGAAAPVLAVRRMLVVLEEEASAEILVCDHTRTPGTQLLALQTVEIFAGRNASLKYYDLEESTADTSRISALYLRQDTGSNVLIDGMTLYNGTTRNEYHCHFDGEEASLRLLGMAICDNTRSISTYSRIEHAVPRCMSDELFKYSADGEARCAFTGRIVVAPGAVKTAAYQACRNLLASDSARIQARPELEIYNDDVKCSHGCAIGQLDPMQVFYMRTRGIPEAQARLLLRQAFMSDIVDPVSIPGLRERLHLLVEKRFAGCSAACSGCSAGKE